MRDEHAAWPNENGERILGMQFGVEDEYAKIFRGGIPAVRESGLEYAIVLHPQDVYKAVQSSVNPFVGLRMSVERVPT